MSDLKFDPLSEGRYQDTAGKVELELCRGRMGDGLRSHYLEMKVKIDFGWDCQKWI